MENGSVLFDKKDNIATLTFNRPENRNSMDKDTLAGFAAGLKKVARDKQLRCLIITGSGDTFCGGADLKNSIIGDGTTLTPETLIEFYRPFLSAGLQKIPVIGAINGHAIGGGFGLALLCDIRIASESAKLGANFTRLGIHSGMAISYILPRLIGVARANELLFTGKLITGRQAEYMGLVNEVAATENVMEKSLDMARQIAASAPVAVQMMKQSIYRELGWQPVRAAELEALSQARTFEMKDAAEGMSALLEKRMPDFKGL